jgi:hypothetical protein
MREVVEMMTIPVIMVKVVKAASSHGEEKGERGELVVGGGMADLNEGKGEGEGLGNVADGLGKEGDLMAIGDTIYQADDGQGDGQAKLTGGKGGLIDDRLQQPSGNVDGDGDGAALAP